MPPVALAGLLVLFAALACDLREPTPAPSPTHTPLPDLRAILERSGETMALLESFRFEMGHQGGGTPIAAGLVITKVAGDVFKPDGLKLSWEGTFVGLFVRAQVIALEGKTYMTNPINGRWETISGDVNPLGFFDPAMGIASMMADLTDASLVGREAVGYVQTYLIKGRLPSQSLAPLLGNVAPDLMVDAEAWIGVEDMLLRRVVFRGRVTPQDAEDIARTITLSGFNVPVTIEAPGVE